MPRFYPPPETVHGPDATTDLDPILDARDWADILVVTDEGVREAGVVDSVIDTLAVEPAVFDAIRPNPSIESVRAVRTAAEDVDAIIAVGGGSVMDAAKAASAVPAFEPARQGDRTAFDALVEWPVTDPAPAPSGSIPLVLVPTTAGTGSETGHWAVISDHDAGEKLSVGHPTAGGDLAVLDPALTTSLPPSVTAASGFDVIAHAVEALVASGDTALTRPYARAGYELAVPRLPVAVRDGDDLAARAAMLSASYLAGLAMNNAGLGAVHAISHAIGGQYDTPHGHTNALLLPEVVRRNASGSKRAFSTYAELSGAQSTPGEALAAQLDTLREMVGLEAELPGLPDAPDWDPVADLAVENLNMATNPVTFDQDTVRDICRATFE